MWTTDDDKSDDNGRQRRKDIRWGSAPREMNLSEEAEKALGNVAEGFCPLCEVPLTRHDDKACCPCGGCSFRAHGHSLWMGSCPEHPTLRCEHWEAVWGARG
jgi:hypothetical protein